MDSIHDFSPTDSSFEALYSHLADIRRDQPVFYSHEHQGWIVTRYDDLVEVVRSDSFTVKNALQGAQNGQYCPEATRILSQGVDWNKTLHVQSEDGPTHARFRRALISVVTPARVREMVPVVQGIVTTLIDRMIDRGECEYVSSFSYPLAMLTTLNLIGFREAEDDMSQFPVWIDDTFQLLLTNMDQERQIRAATNAVAFQNYIRDKITARRAAPQQDLLSEILTLLSAGEANLSDDELVIMFTHSFVGAGHETTKLALTNSIYHLLVHRERWEALLSHPGDVSKFAEECLRYDAPLLAWFRYCTVDSEIGGQTIRAGDKVIIMYGSANHDAAKFEKAEEYCPFRTDTTPHLTFNTGKHFCVGAPLARLELNTALSELSRRIPSLRLRPGQTQISYAANFGNRVIPQLYLEWNRS